MRSRSFTQWELNRIESKVLPQASAEQRQRGWDDHVTLVCLCVCLSVCLYICVCLSVCLSVGLRLSICLCVCMCICLCVCVCVYVCLSVAVCLSVYLSLCLSVCVCMCICLFVCLRVCLSVTHHFTQESRLTTVPWAYTWGGYAQKIGIIVVKAYKAHKYGRNNWMTPEIWPPQGILSHHVYEPILYSYRYSSFAIF